MAAITEARLVEAATTAELRAAKVGSMAIPRRRLLHIRKGLMRYAVLVALGFGLIVWASTSVHVNAARLSHSIPRLAAKEEAAAEVREVAAAAAKGKKERKEERLEMCWRPFQQVLRQP